jgi:hypothetical protein
VFFVRPSAIEVDSGRTTRVSIEVMPGVEVILACVGEKALEYNAVDGSGTMIDQGRADYVGDGLFRIVLPTGPTTIHLSSSTGREGLVRVDVGSTSDGAPSTVELQ